MTQVNAMSNPKGNPSSLKSYKPKWNHGKTRTIRVPIVLVNQIMEYAYKLDKDEDSTLTQVYEGEYNDEDEEQELEEDDSEPSDSEIIKMQAQTMQKQLAEIRYLERDIEELKSKHTHTETLTQAIRAIEDVCNVPNTSKFTNRMKEVLVKNAIEPLKSLTQVNKR